MKAYKLKHKSLSERKVVYERPSGLKSRLKAILSAERFRHDESELEQSKEHIRLVYVLAFFHAAIQVSH